MTSLVSFRFLVLSAFLVYSLTLLLQPRGFLTFLPLCTPPTVWARLLHAGVWSEYFVKSLLCFLVLFGHLETQYPSPVLKIVCLLWLWLMVDSTVHGEVATSVL